MSTWFPIGPDFVYATRDSAVPMRLSRGNELGRQAKVKALAVDATSSPPTLYTVEQPYPQVSDDFPQYYPQNPYWPVGGSAFVSQDSGLSWTPIADTLIQDNPGVTPTCIAVHPLQPANIYLGTDSGDIFVSNSRGQSWGPAQSLGAGNQINQIVVDPRNAGNPATTTLYAATSTGLQISTNGGSSWTPTSLSGYVMSLAFNMPASGTADLYAGVQGVGLYHATTATGTWTLLNGSGSGLPLQSVLGFEGVLVDFCRLNPQRVYVVLGTDGAALNLYTSSAGPTGFSAVTSASMPSADLYRFAFAVAPNSPGDGANDILFFSGVQLFRSSSAGTVWDVVADDLHYDHNCFGFSTLAPSPGEIPTTYVGCDGGLYASTSFADGTVDVAVYPSDFGDGLDTPSGVSQNYNHQKLSLAVRAYAADPASGAYGYTGGQDTGLAGRIGVLGWRGLDNSSDVWGVAALGGFEGLSVWYTTPFQLLMITDQGQTVPPVVQVGTTTQFLSGSGAMRVNADGQCLTGAYVYTSLPSAVTSTGMQSVTPESMLGITPGVDILINDGLIVVVASVTATSFMADFAETYAAGASLKVFCGLVFSIAQTGLATPVSQPFGADTVKTLAAHPTDATSAAMITGNQATANQRVWTTSGVPLSPSTVWTEVAGSTKPSGGLISAVAIDPSGLIYVLLTDLTWTAPGGAPVTTPLYEVSTGSWIPQPAASLPSGPFGSLVVHPLLANTLYATSGAQVYELTLSAGTWTWTQVGSGLPGQAIVDLWIGDVGSVTAPMVLLHAAVVSRGMWEANVTSGAATADPPTRPYMRHQALDQGWLVPSLEGQTNPFNPSAGPSLYHWESPDIKVDAQQPGPPPFYQNEPVYHLPIPHGAFDQIIDNSQNLPESDSANVHVQVHNRSYTALSDVSVWAIWANCSAGVPSLSASASQSNDYPFWSQFQSSGSIVPSLPSDSPWHAVGSPTTVSNLVTSNPQVASFPNWAIPTLGAGDPGHYCIVSFAHSAANPIDETSYDVDSISTNNLQVAQRNLHVSTLAPMNQIHRLEYGLIDYVEFHNPLGEEALADLVFDLRGLPPSLVTAVQITHVETRDGLDRSIIGGTLAGELTRPHDCHRWLGDWHDRLDKGPADGGRPVIRIPEMAPGVYLAHPSSTFEVRGVRQAPHASAAALFAIAAADRTALTREFQFQVLRRVDGKIVGGSTFVIKPAILPKTGPNLPPFFIEPPFGKPELPSRLR